MRQRFGSMLALTALVSTGCSGPGGATSAHGTPILDEHTGSVVLPLDRYWMSTDDDLVLRYAVAIAIYRCMQGKGYPLPRPTRPTATPSSPPYGVWSVDVARTHGYAGTTQDLGGGAPDLGDGTPADLAYATCADSDQARALRFDGKGSDLSFVGVRPAVKSPEGQAAVREWAQCLTSAGITPPDPASVSQGDSWIPPSAREAVREIQFEIAVKDVACKQRARLVPRLAQQDADIQQAVIDQHEAQLAEFRKQWTAVLVRDKALVADFEKTP